MSIDPAAESAAPAHTTAERAARVSATAAEGRRATLAQLAAETFDVLVIGGGITGAGVAREAALRGLRVALIERDDFASGTSSRSSRLIHGGVRYLEHGHLGLVFESSRERRLLLDLAPHLVRPLAFTWPVYRGDRVPRWKMRAGLLLYDALSLFRNERSEGLNGRGIVEAEPALSTDELRGGARYFDAATDDTRLTLATVLAAREAGAVVANHAALQGGVHEQHQLAGVTIEDRLTGDLLAVRANVIINATGPWSDATSSLTGLPPQDAVHGAVGAHISVSRKRLGNREAITLLSPLDGRVMFVLPAGAHTIIGTTERPATGGPDDVRATEQEVTYLLHSVNARFPHAQLTPDDVVSAWAGIRPLAAARAGSNGDTGSASREHAIVRAPNGLVSVTGGKLTTYRAMAIDIVDSATGHDASGDQKTRSEEEPLPGGDIVSLSQAEHDAGAATHDAAVGARLAQAYGSRWRNVWSYAQRSESLRQRIAPTLPYIMAEVAHAVEREMAHTLADILIRRTHIAFETHDHGRAASVLIAPLVGELLGWSESQRAAAVDTYARDATRLFSIEPV